MQVFNEGRGAGWQHIYFTIEYETTRNGPNLGIRWKIKWEIDKNYWYGYNLVADVWTEGNNYGRQIKANSPNRGSGETNFPSNGDFYWFNKGYESNQITGCKILIKTTNGGSVKLDTGGDKILTTPTGYTVSTIKDSIDFIVGNDLKVKINDITNQNYSYLLYLDVMNDSNSWENVKSLTTTNKDFTLDLSSIASTIYSKVTTKNSAKIRINLHTYINNTHLGYTTKEGTCYIKNSNPTALSFTITNWYEEEITGLTAGYGPYNPYSNIWININKILNDNGINSAKLKKVKITIGNTTRDINISNIVGTGTHQEEFIDPFANIKDNELVNGKGAVIVSITDSRGNTTSTKKEIAIGKYTPAYFTELEVKRNNNIDTTTRLIAKGKTMHGVTIQYVSPVGEELGIFKVINDSYITINEATQEFTVNAPIEGDLGANGFTKNKQFDVIIQLNDSWSVTNPRRYTRYVRRGDILMHYGKKGIAYGGLYDEAKGGALQSAGLAILNQLEIENLRTISDCNNTALNNGIYYWNSATLNSPKVGSAGFIKIVKYSDTNITQIVYRYRDNEIYERHYNTVGTTGWKDWIPVATCKKAIAITSFQNGWTNYGTGYEPAKYKVIGNLVQLQGLIKNGTTDKAAFTLPAAIRPSYTKIFPSVCPAGFAQVRINNGGAVIPQVRCSKRICNFRWNIILFRIKQEV